MPLLIAVNTNAAGVLTAMQAARQGGEGGLDGEYGQLKPRLLELFRGDLLGLDRERAGVVAIVDDHLAAQPLLLEMQVLASLMPPFAERVLVVDAADLSYHDGRLRHRDIPIDRVYWCSADFLLSEPAHAPVRRVVLEQSTLLAPAPEAYRAITDKRRLVTWSQQPELARDPATGLSFRLAETLPMSARTLADWYAERTEWVFKPVSGAASQDLYVVLLCP